MGALGVAITNGSTLPVSHLELEQARADERPELVWRMNPRVIGARPTVETLRAGDSRMFPIEFTDDGELVRFAGSLYAITYSFTDAAGRRWRRTGGAG